MKASKRWRLAGLAGGSALLATLSVAWACTVLAPHAFQPTPATACTPDSSGPNGYRCQPIEVTGVGGHIPGLQPGQTHVRKVYQNTVDPGSLGLLDPVGSCSGTSTEIGSITYTARVADPADPNNQTAEGVGEATPQVATNALHPPNRALLYKICEVQSAHFAPNALIAIAKLGS